MEHQLTVVVYAEIYAVCRLDALVAVPEWAKGAEFISITRTAIELSIVCQEDTLPAEISAERNRRLMRIEGPLAFSLTGVLASVTAPLARAEISIFAVSTYETDYLLVSDKDLQKATEVLEAAGHPVRRLA